MEKINVVGAEIFDYRNYALPHSGQDRRDDYGRYDPDDDSQDRQR